MGILVDRPVILRPARSLHNLRMGEAARKALSEGRLLILSVFGDEVRRTTLPQALFHLPPGVCEHDLYGKRGDLAKF